MYDAVILKIQSEILKSMVGKDPKYKKAGWLSRLTKSSGCVMGCGEEKGSQVRKSMLSKS